MKTDYKENLPATKNPFSVFFHSASSKKKINLFSKIAKKANQDQRDLVKRAKS